MQLNSFCTLSPPSVNRSFTCARSSAMGHIERAKRCSYAREELFPRGYARPCRGVVGYYLATTTIGPELPLQECTD